MNLNWTSDVKWTSNGVVMDINCTLMDIFWTYCGHGMLSAHL